MENGIELKNIKLIIFSLIFVLLIGYLLITKNINEEFNNIKEEVEKLFGSNSFITFSDNSYENYSLTYGELNWEGMENIIKYM